MQFSNIYNYVFSLVHDLSSPHLKSGLGDVKISSTNDAHYNPHYAIIKMYLFLLEQVYTSSENKLLMWLDIMNIA